MTFKILTTNSAETVQDSVNKRKQFLTEIMLGSNTTVAHYLEKIISSCDRNFSNQKSMIPGRSESTRLSSFLAIKQLYLVSRTLRLWKL